MSEITNFEALENELGSLLEKKLFSDIREYKQRRLQSLRKMMEEILQSSTAAGSSRLESEIQEKIRSLPDELKNEFESARTIPVVYIKAVDNLAGEARAYVRAEQLPHRFEPMENDSVFLKVAKAGKRLGRSLDVTKNRVVNSLRKARKKPEVGHGLWLQNIPLKRLIQYHLFELIGLPMKWMNENGRLQMALVMKLEQFLAEKLARGSEEKNGDAEAFAKELIQMIEHELSVYNKMLDDDKYILQQELMKYIRKAGTIERWASTYKEVRVKRIRSFAEKTLPYYHDEWQDVQNVLTDKVRILDEFLNYELTLTQQNTAFRNSVETYFKNRFHSPVEEIEQELNAATKKLREAGNNRKVINQLLKSIQEQLGDLVNIHFAAIQQSLEQGELTGIAELFSEQVLIQAGDLSEKALFVFDEELDKDPPDLNFRMIEWRMLVVRALKDQFLSDLQPSKQNYGDFLEARLNEMKEIREVIEVNLTSSLELLEGEAKAEKDDDPIAIAGEALERSQAKLELYVESIQKKYDEVDEMVQKNLETFSKSMANFLHDGDSTELQVLEAKYRIKERAQGWQTKLSARWARIQDKITLFGRFGVKKGKKYLDAIKEFLGFEKEQVEDAKKADIAAYLSETDAKLKELPYIYRRLFNFKEETDRRFYVALNQKFGYLKSAYERWENGFPAAFAIIGEKGSGKTTYLNFAMEEIFSKEIKRIKLEETYWTREQFFELITQDLDLKSVESVEEIITSLKKQKKHKVIVIEALENLYLRNIHGYDAIENLLYLISETKNEIFWITSCSIYAWLFLDKTESLSEYFSHILRCDTLNEEQIEEAIMNRHRSSGYELVFEPDESHRKSRAYRKLMDKGEEAQAYLRKAYFEELAELSEGNASIAMMFWIRSIREFDDTHLYIKPLEVTSLEMIEDLKPDTLFTMAAIILHDTVTAEQLSHILNFNEYESRLILKRLKSRGLLNEMEGSYMLNHLMYRQVMRVLKKRNIIHLY